MKQQFLSYKESKISYLLFGSGPRVVLCFHGYGEEGNAYSFFENIAGKEFIFISLDLPFHGKTNWNSGAYFQKTDLEIIIRNILSENKIDIQGKHQPFTFIGFSLGGRIALSVYEIFPQQVEKIILLAPDGLKINFWYRLSTQTWLGKKLFAFTMNYPGWFFVFLRVLIVIRLVNKRIFKFVKYYIGNKEMRRLLYQRWTVLGKIKPDTERIKKLIVENKTRVSLIYGQYDRVIIPDPGKKFRKGIERFVSIKMIKTGHQVLHKNHAAEILPFLTGKKDNP